MAARSLAGSVLAVPPSNEHLVDLVVVDVKHFEGVVPKRGFVGTLGDLPQHVHHEARDGLIGGVLGKIFDAERMFEVVDRRSPVNKPGVVVALNDLHILCSGYEFAHNRRHNIVDGDDADDESIFVENDGKVRVRALKDVKHLGERKRIGDELTGLQQPWVLEGDGFFVEDAPQKMLGIHETNDVIEIRGLKIDKTARRVWVDGTEKQFTTKEFDLLCFLAEHPNRVFTKEELFREIWSGEPVRLLGIRTSKLADEAEPVQLSIFDIELPKEPDEKHKKLNRALDELNSRYGKGAVIRASMMKKDGNEKRKKTNDDENRRR